MYGWLLLVVLLAGIAVFVHWLFSEDQASERALRARLAEYQRVIADIRRIAALQSDFDPIAEQIMARLREFDAKPLP